MLLFTYSSFIRDPDKEIAIYERSKTERKRKFRIREAKINTGLLREPDCDRIPKAKPALQALFTFVSTYES